MSGDLRYSADSIRGDFVRSGIGLFSCLFPLFLLDGFNWLSWLLSALALMFLIFGYRSWIRAGTAYRITADGLRRERPRAALLRWQDLTGMKLRYYSTQRNREKGWFQLQLETDSERIKLDSNLDDFEKILRIAVQALRHNNVTFDPATWGNLGAFGLDREG